MKRASPHSAQWAAIDWEFKIPIPVKTNSLWSYKIIFKHFEQKNMHKKWLPTWRKKIHSSKICSLLSKFILPRLLLCPIWFWQKIWFSWFVWLFINCLMIELIFQSRIVISIWEQVSSFCDFLSYALGTIFSSLIYNIIFVYKTLKIWYVMK